MALFYDSFYKECSPLDDRRFRGKFIFFIYLFIDYYRFRPLVVIIVETARWTFYNNICNDGSVRPTPRPVRRWKLLIGGNFGFLEFRFVDWTVSQILTVTLGKKYVRNRTGRLDYWFHCVRAVELGKLGVDRTDKKLRVIQEFEFPKKTNKLC